MANRVKEDEKNERIIRGLLKLPENRRCINCNSLGPQYVCTNFWTFVCTTCSGIHREFTHRVKSVSMAKFAPHEVSALQEGGNQRARETYLKEWDPQRQSFPDGSNIERLRDFIKHVYVDRRYSGERNYSKPPSMKGEKEEFSDNRRADSYQGGSRSPPYEESYEHRYSEMSSPGGRSDDRNSRYGYDERRSPGYDQEGRNHSNYRRSPARPEVINDWRRDDRFGNAKKTDGQKISDGDSKLEIRSPEQQKDSEASSPPTVRPVREILGDNTVPLRIAEPPKANVTRVGDAPAQPQRTTSSSSMGSSYANPVEVKLENTKSLIDFDSDLEPPIYAAVSQKVTIPESSAPFASSANDDNWASFDSTPEVKVSSTPSNANPLESVLSQLSISAPVGAQVSGISSGIGASVTSVGNTLVMGASPVANASMFPYNVSASVGNRGVFLPVGVPASSPGIAQTASVNTPQAGQWSSLQLQQPSHSGGLSTAQQNTPSGVALGNQTWSSPLGPNTPSVGGPRAITNTASKEVKLTGRKELPEDLFTASYSPFYAPVPGWQPGPPSGMVFTIPYANSAMPMPTIPHMPKSANPFDNEPPSVQAQSFPSVAIPHSALPNMLPSSGLQRTSSLGTPLSAWNTSRSVSYPSGFPSQTPSYSSATPPRPHVAQQFPHNIPFSGHMGPGSLVSEGAIYGAINMDQQHGFRSSSPATSQPFSSVGGNPFG